MNSLILISSDQGSGFKPILSGKDFIFFALRAKAIFIPL
jgi:hypothetical protein